MGHQDIKPSICNYANSANGVYHNMSNYGWSGQYPPDLEGSSGLFLTMGLPKKSKVTNWQEKRQKTEMSLRDGIFIHWITADNRSSAIADYGSQDWITPGAVGDLSLATPSPG